MVLLPVEVDVLGAGAVDCMTREVGKKSILEVEEVVVVDWVLRLVIELVIELVMELVMELVTEVKTVLVELKTNGVDGLGIILLDFCEDLLCATVVVVIIVTAGSCVLAEEKPKLLLTVSDVASTADSVTAAVTEPGT